MNLLIITAFAIGYVAITLESKLKVNKAAIALLMAVFCWGFNFAAHIPPDEAYLHHLVEHLGEISQVIIFLMGAMTIVALIEAHQGFRIITDFIRTRNKVKILWSTSIITFFLSSLLDNLTTSIIMVALIRKLIDDRNDRMFFSAMVIIAANAGGAWSPIGDVTTTMLWIGNRLTTGTMIKLLFIPSLISTLIPLFFLSRCIKNDSIVIPHQIDKSNEGFSHAKKVFFLGMATLIFVPILKALLGMPPYMGIILGLGVMWVLTDLINNEQHHLKVPHILTKIDISSVLFFLGILLAVAALETAGVLNHLTLWMNAHFKNMDIVATFMGLISSIIDNVPLTAAAMGMYDLHTYPLDSKFWLMIAYAVGTGGSILIIGSAAGVVVMGMEKISFGWYLRRISLPVLIGYLIGIFSFLAIYMFLN